MSDIEASKLANAQVFAMHKEWDDASCPICMDHPHNAVLLICSSFDQGCRSYMCDTSYRHSNCLDRYKKLRANSDGSNNDEGRGHHQRSPSENHSEEPSDGARMRGNPSSDLQESSQNAGVPVISTEADNEIARNIAGHDSDGQLKCPLCRGTVHGWKIVKEAREYLDLKPRACSRESCSFVGNYHELRRHARRVHPSIRPADVDPSRQRAWRHLEHQREYGDIVSAIRSAMPGAIVLGDYVLDNDNGQSLYREGAAAEGTESGPWWTTLFLFHMLGPVGNRDERRGSSRSWRRHRRSSGGDSRRRYPWGERLLGLYEDEDDWNSTSDAGDDFSTPRRRRRFTRPRNDDEQP
ncbi:hypothetical protein EJ110_NYTH44821 [Nymphaea thermarum]|nr:hypothetical protein EJ110_NYTH44821 [Nymphaea thermarum]